MLRGMKLCSYLHKISCAGFLQAGSQIVFIYLIIKLFLTDEKHHRDADEAFRNISERTTWCSKGTSRDFLSIIHLLTLSELPFGENKRQTTI